MAEAIKDKPRKSSYVPGTLYDKNPKTGKRNHVRQMAGIRPNQRPPVESSQI